MGDILSRIGCCRIVNVSGAESVEAIDGAQVQANDSAAPFFGKKAEEIVTLALVVLKVQSPTQPAFGTPNTAEGWT